MVATHRSAGSPKSQPFETQGSGSVVFVKGFCGCDFGESRSHEEFVGFYFFRSFGWPGTRYFFGFPCELNLMVVYKASKVARFVFVTGRRILSTFWPANCLLSFCQVEVHVCSLKHVASSLGSRSKPPKCHGNGMYFMPPKHTKDRCKLLSTTISGDLQVVWVCVLP